MQMKFSLYFFAAVMSLLLTACSSNNVKPENNQLLSNSKTNQQIVKRAKIKKKKVSQSKPKPKPKSKPVLKVSKVSKVRRNVQKIGTGACSADTGIYCLCFNKHERWSISITD